MHDDVTILFSYARAGARTPPTVRMGASFQADLLGYALGMVNWDELADVWIQNVREQVTS